MKKLFFLIIANWATSCLPVPDTQSSSAHLMPTKETETNKKPKQKDILNKSLYHGSLSGAMVSVSIAYCFITGTTLALSAPIVALGLGTTVVCSLLQNHYWISEDDKKNTTSKERVFAHATGIGLVSALGVVVVKGVVKQK